MLTFSTLPGDECVAYLAADALYRAGYSAWPSSSPCLEGKHVLLQARLSSDRTEISLQGGLGHADIFATRRLEGGSSIKPEDVHFLLADALSSAGFRRLVGNIPADQSADRFAIQPLDPQSIESACAPPSTAP